MPGEWRSDPTGRHEYRYWDGSAWTANVSDLGKPSVDSDVIPAPDVIPLPPPPNRRAVTAYEAPVRNNGLAIASMVLGILWIWWLGSLLAVIFGHVSLSQIGKSNGRQTGRGMAIAGLVLGYIGIATFAIVIAIFVIGGTTDNGNASACKSDALTLETAEEVQFAKSGTYTTESGLAPIFHEGRSGGVIVAG